MNLTTKQQDLLTVLDQLGFTASWWAPAGQDIQQVGRVYFKLKRRDAKVFLAFDHAGELAGLRLKINIDDCGQTAAWYESQREILRAKFAIGADAALALGEDAGDGDPAAEQQRARTAIKAALEEVNS